MCVTEIRKKNRLLILAVLIFHRNHTLPSFLSLLSPLLFAFEPSHLEELHE